MIQSIAQSFVFSGSAVQQCDSPVTPDRWLTQWMIPRTARIPTLQGRLAPYATAIAALAVATVVRLLLDPVFENRAPYGIYLIAVLFVAWRAGFGPALVTIGGGALLGRYLFDAPRWSLAIVDEANLTSLAMSLTVGIIAALLCQSLRITARENRRLYETARLADSRKDEFLATLAHELRNPLTPIRNAVYLLDHVEHREPRVEELRQMIDRHAEHLTRLVNDLLDVSRITQGRISLQRETEELQNVIAGAVDVVRPLIEEKQQDLHVALPAGTVYLHADGVRLTQVVTNLLHNAAKYTDVAGRVWLSAEVEGDQLVMRVRDNGMGIAPEKCDQIFDLFQQVHQGIEQSQGGLGIGLTLVRALVVQHGGTVEGKSQGLGLGSEFTVRLPVVVPYRESEIAATESGTEKSAAGPESVRVLIVDDSPAVARSLEMVLADWKYAVPTCADGFSALEEARTFKPHVILADLGMPRMNGYQLAEQLRRMPAMRDTSLIAVSGYGQPADQQRSQAAGFSRHLVKPIDLGELKQILAASSLRANH